MVKFAAGGAVFDRNFYRGFYGGIPDIHESRMLIIKRSKSESEKWGGAKWTPLSETYEIKKDGPIYKEPLQHIMGDVLLRGFEEELKPDSGMPMPHIEYIGNYKDHETGFIVYVYLGHLHTNSPWFSRKDFKKRFHPDPKEVEKIDWRTMPEIIEMIKEGKFVSKQFIDFIIQEIERRATKNAAYFPNYYLDTLSRLRYDIQKIKV